MAQFVQFFSRQAIAGNASSSGTIYSDIFDVAGVRNVDLELRLFTFSGSGVDPQVAATIEQTPDPSFAQTWSTYTGLAGTGVATYSGVFTTTPKRFVRAKLDISAGSVSIVSFQARGFE